MFYFNAVPQIFRRCFFILHIKMPCSGICNFSRKYLRYQDTFDESNIYWGPLFRARISKNFFFYFLFFKLFTQKFCPLYEKFIRFVFLVFDLYIDRQPTNLFVLILVSLNVDGMLFSNKKINNKNNKKKFYPKKRKKKSL